MNREHALAALRDSREPWDFIIVGGGATGLGCAVDAAARGHRVVLVEPGTTLNTGNVIGEKTVAELERI